MATCKGCGADIIWMEKLEGKRVPVDAKAEKRFVKVPLTDARHNFTYVDGAAFEKLLDDLDEAERERDALKAALAGYRDEHNAYKNNWPDEQWLADGCPCDICNAARKALNKLKEGKRK